tara:strand:+ start:1072 stop:2643 length:1572 start_codon:yes stop_codon:yes gene_type:complete
MIKKEKYILFIGVLLIAVISFYLSLQYSVYHTDYIHWGHILEKYYQFSNNQKIHQEIFLQYGEGYLWLFWLFDIFIDINLVSIGMILGLIHSLKLILIYLISCKIINDKKLSFLLTLNCFLVLTHVQIPWTDFISGFALLVFVYFFIKLKESSNNNLLVIFSSFLLFLTIFFRNTYILNFILCSALYLIIEFFFLEKKKYIRRIIFYTYLFLISYFLYLYLNNNFSLWYTQAIGGSDDIYLTSTNFDIYDFVYKIFFYVARLGWHLFVPKTYLSAFITVVYILNIYFLVKKVNFFKKINKQDNTLIFLSVYGLVSVIQAINIYELWRIINASSPIFFTSFYILKEIFEKNKVVKFLGLFIIIFNILISFKYYPISSNFHNIVDLRDSKDQWHTINKDIYVKSDIKLFGNKKLRSEFNNFYKNLQNIICEYDIIYNLSSNKELSLLCNKFKIIKKTNTLTNEHPSLGKKVLQQNYKKNNNSIIISNYKLENYELIYTSELPTYYRFTGSDTYMRFYRNKIYLYK